MMLMTTIDNLTELQNKTGSNNVYSALKRTIYLPLVTVVYSKLYRLNSNTNNTYQPNHMPTTPYSSHTTPQPHTPIITLNKKTPAYVI